MTNLLIGVLLVIAAGLLERIRRHRAWWDGAHYREQIQALKPEKPLPLNPIQPLRGHVVSEKTESRVIAFVARGGYGGTGV